MSNGYSSQEVVRSGDLRLPVQNPLPCDPNIDHPLDNHTPYVLDSHIQKLQIRVQVFAQTTCDYSTILASFGADCGFLGMADASSGTTGITISSTLNHATMLDMTTVEIDLAAIPDSILHMIGGVVSASAFSEWPGNKLEIEVTGLTNGTPRQRFRSCDEVSRRLGHRKIADLAGSAYAFVSLVRHGAYWHMYPLLESVDGVRSVLDFRRQMTEGADVRRWLGRYQMGAHAPERRRIVLHVSSGHELAVKDRSLFGSFLKKSKGSSDPYCKVFCGHTEQKYEVMPKTLNPTWSYDEGAPHTLRAVAESDPRVFLVHVFDHDDHTADDFMGCCYVPVAHAFTLPLGTHHIKVALEPMGSEELNRIKTEYGEWSQEYRTHHSKPAGLFSSGITGYLSIELHSSEEPKGNTTHLNFN